MQSRPSTKQAHQLVLLHSSRCRNQIRCSPCHWKTWGIFPSWRKQNFRKDLCYWQTRILCGFRIVSWCQLPHQFTQIKRSSKIYFTQDYRVKYRTSIPIEEIVVYICDIKQYYTQIGGSRPFGAAFLFAGYDKQGKFQLYSTDPSGNYAGWKATAIGSNHVAANSFLKQ